ncbi:MAG TPA: sodium:alanine symporter family protein [Candidatus Blautia pullistercoris]|uniref:Sodium:alanine symporter family protein n=1 Tax=Candidatus Blautia pullistercoris TaxID=2838499 RepID=A0A9D1VJM9_9FIRM|nr:sodium:alanine symporter family protein [Clostridiales bacterium]HIX36264.1 sodium:alanine symporter family protein [Candidatus Blautia pullistercoris]
MEELIHGLQRLVWGPGMLVFFLGTGIRFTIRSKFFQIRKIHIWMGKTLGAIKNGRKTEKEHSISQFQSFCTALAATLGTGNITGVATALIFGGPGAVFWMWVSAFFGMMTNYGENYLGIRYRYKDKKGRWVGGAMVYMERGLNSRFLAVLFAVCCLIASLGMGNMVQGNSMAKGLETAFGIPPFITGSACMILLAVIVTGGVKRVAALTEKLVPCMAGIYLLGALAVLAANWQAVPKALEMIFTQAFQIRAGVGGAAGYTVRQALRMGVARGIFSNEAGLGSSVMAHVQSDVESPQIQGMWGMLEVFIDTMVGCTVTALVILVSGVYQPELYLDQISRGIEPVDGTTLTGQAFAAVIPWGAQFLAAATALFAFATIAGWSYFGEQTAAYLGKEKGAMIYRYVYILLTLPGCILAPSLIWDLSDAFNGMMALPNLVALFFLGKQVKYDNGS